MPVWGSFHHFDGSCHRRDCDVLIGGRRLAWCVLQAWRSGMQKRRRTTCLSELFIKHWTMHTAGVGETRRSVGVFVYSDVGNNLFHPTLNSFSSPCCVWRRSCLISLEMATHDPLYCRCTAFPALHTLLPLCWVAATLLAPHYPPE